MKRLIVTTDLSANSKAGIRFALQMAKQVKAELVFCYISEVTQPASWSDRHYDQFRKEKIAEITPKLKNFVSGIAGKGRLSMPAKFIVELGLNADRTIISVAKKYKADFICMSTRGAGKMKKIFGTTASKIITTSPTPVIVVPQRYLAKKIDKVFFASDFASLQKELKPVMVLSSALKAKVQVFHYDYLLDVPENVKRLEAKVKKNQAKNLSFHFRKMKIDYTLADHLAKDIRKEKPSLVVLFTKQNRDWFERLFLPSEAAEMSFHTNIPLLTFRKK
ncbi:MAG: universal stress protein [Bacteroidia bacterium]